MNKRQFLLVRLAVLTNVTFLVCGGRAADTQVLSWNNLGMHCMDSDYSVFSILPPYNTIEAQLLVGGKLVTNAVGFSVTYQAVVDPTGSFNSTSAGKTSFYDFAPPLYGANPLVDAGLLQWGMPGTNNIPQTMFFEQTNFVLVNWFRAEGIPITPYDDSLRKNPYPLMRIIAHSAGVPIATNDIVLPVSDEMDCRVCHASGTDSNAIPATGWVWAENPERDYRLNILRRHDTTEFSQHSALYAAALAARGFNPQGLYHGVVADGKPVLCAACHASEALGAPSYGTIPQLTTSVHGFHAHVMDPDLHVTLDNSANRAACYRCHPGSTTKCLRGAMGGAVAGDGSMEMQCQSCHGSMSQVGATNRIGWFMEPNCQSCHSGTATINGGQIRFTSAFTDTNGTVRVPADPTFATNPNTPASGISLFRFSSGHGGLQCEACHGSTHAEFPSTHLNDNLRNIAIQGHAGVMVECNSCHTAMPNTIAGGPHGMHPVGQAWVGGHGDLLEGLSKTMCQTCHGIDYRGTVLSRAQADRTLTAFGTQFFFRGALIGCYACHKGPNSENGNTSAPPTVSNISTNTTNDQPVTIPLSVIGAGATLRIISQPANGSVGLSNTIATYFPNPGFVGIDAFTFAACDGAKNSQLATGTVVVAQGRVGISARALVPPQYSAGWAAPFSVVATPVNFNVAPTYEWDFGDNSPHSTNQYTSHAYAAPGSYQWSVVSKAQSGMLQATVTNKSTITIQAPAALAASVSSNGVTFSWQLPWASVLLEESESLGPAVSWTVSTNTLVFSNGTWSATVSNPNGTCFYRLRKL